MPSIYIYDSNQWGGFGVLHDVSIQVFSVADMVTKVSKVLEQYRDLNELTLAGVGGVVFQSVGANGTTDDTGDRSLQLDENGNLKGGGGRYLSLLANRIGKIYLSGLSTDGKYGMLLIAVGKSLGGNGVIVKSQNTYLKYYNDGSQRTRRTTHEATVGDRDALRGRLSEYTKG